MQYLAETVQHNVVVYPFPLFNLNGDQLTALIIVVALVMSHIVSRLIVAELRDRRAR